MDVALGFAMILFLLSTLMVVFGVPTGSSQLAQVIGSVDGSDCSFTRYIVHRDSGDDVECLQQYLVAQGHLDSVKSFFNTDVGYALKQWQRENGMEEAGWFGPISQRIYNDLNGHANESIADCSFTRNLIFQDRGEDVRCLQMYLWDEGYFKNEANAIYDSFTSRAVRSWQADNDLDWQGYFIEDDIARYYDLLDGSVADAEADTTEEESAADEDSITDTTSDTPTEETDTPTNTDTDTAGDQPSAGGTEGSGSGAAICQFTQNLGHRSRGDDVTCLQRYLIAKGYMHEEATGFYGLVTRQAVGAWQLAHNIGDSGVWGPVSRILYAEEFSIESGVNSSCTFTRDLVQQMTGEDVRCLQTYLYRNGHYQYEATAFYGSLTKAAVRSWQLAAGVPVTGTFDYASRVKYASLNGQAVPPVPGTEDNTPPVVDEPEDTPTDVPTVPTDTTPPIVSYDVAAISNMPANSWLAYGRPWSDIDPGRAANCGVLFSKVLGAWNGGLWDGKYFWMWAGGGHADGCFNGLMRYDIEKGVPEMVIPHKALNVPLCRVYSYDANGNPADCWNEPYVSETPWPGGMDLTKAEKLLAGPTIDKDALDAVDDTFGAYLRPRSSHMYNNMIRIGDYIYLATGQIYGSGKGDGQVWRVSATNPTASTIKRLPDRLDSRGDSIGGYNTNWIHIPGLGPSFVAGSEICQTDPVAGTYDCDRSSNFYVSNGATVAWDSERNGFWAVDSVLGRLTFVRRDGADWKTEVNVTDQRIMDMGREGICLVPTENGAQPLMWGNADYLLRFDGTRLSELTVPGGPGAGGSRIFNKWTWNDSLGVCMGTRSTDEGMWVFKPGFTDGSTYVPPEGSEDPTVPTTPTEPSDPVSGTGRINVLEIEGYLTPDEFPTVGGVQIAPRAWEPAAVHERIERQPEAPDYDSICSGTWTEMNLRTDADFVGLDQKIRDHAKAGGANLRIFVHTLFDLEGDPIAYAGRIKFDGQKCGEVIGVPKDGQKPQMLNDVAFGGTSGGLIVRGINFGFGAGVAWTGSRALNKYPEFVVIHDSHTHEKGSLMGDSPPSAPHTYLEFRGNIIGHNPDWHVIYLERSVGKMVALSNVFYGSGNAGHAFKNLAHESRMEGNVFSNVGLDGQPLKYDKNGNEIVGLMPLDLYGCTDTVFKDNTVLFRTSGNVRTFMGYRGRRAWGNCDKGMRNSDGTWDVWAPESATYDDPRKWADIAEAAEAFDDGYAAAKNEPWLFTHLNEGNRYVVFNAATTGDGAVINSTTMANLVTLRPVADNTVKAVLSTEARALADSCKLATNRTACFVAGMSDALRYVYEHVSPAWQLTMSRIGDLPSGVPIPAPDEWIERAGLYVGENEFITCNGAGTSCNRNTERVVDAAPNSWDDVSVKNPPRVYYY